jgi:hypothetical protein
MSTLIKLGSSLVYEIANFDLVAQYAFIVKSVGDGMGFEAGQLSKGAPLAEFNPTLLITCSEEAVEAGKGPVLMHRGKASAGEEDLVGEQVFVQAHTPPFLLARSLYARLASGERVELEIGDQLHELAEEELRVLDRDDEAYKAIKRFGGEVLVATGGDDGSVLVVARDSACPLIVFMEWEGECHVSYLRREDV